LDDLAGEGLVALDEPSRADRFGNGGTRGVREVRVEKAGRELILWNVEPAGESSL
jgi:hypothetical protein